MCACFLVKCLCNYFSCVSHVESEFGSDDDDDDEARLSEWKYNALCVSVHALDFEGVFVQY